MKVILQQRGKSQKVIDSSELERYGFDEWNIERLEDFQVNSIRSSNGKNTADPYRK